MKPDAARPKTFSEQISWQNLREIYKRRNKNTTYIWVLAILSLIVQLRWLYGSAPVYVAAILPQDDSYYYLQPAWMFSRTGRFTFDGIHLTYGFQPLWMICMVVFAKLSTTKMGLLLASLTFGSVCYTSTALALHNFIRLYYRGWHALFVPAAWLTSFRLLNVNVTGKENSLFGLLLVLCLISLHRLTSNKPAPKFEPLRFGVLAGLLCLCRINAVPFALIAFVALYFHTRKKGSQTGDHESKDSGAEGQISTGRIQTSPLFISIAGAFVVVAPWCLYASQTFGTIMPTSGIRKLIGIKAGIAYWLSLHAPFLSTPTLAGLLSPIERQFLAAPSRLVQPDFLSAFRFGYIGVANIAFGRVWPFLVLLFVVAAVSLLFAAVRPRMELSPKEKLQGWTGWRSKDLLAKILEGRVPIVVLVVFSVLNTSLNALFLGDYLAYATWYLVPETVLITLVVSLLAGEALNTFSSNWFEFARGFLRASVVVWFLLFVSRASPRHDGNENPAHWMRYFLMNWANDHIPDGSRVGSWNAGMIGYFAQGYTVINLDGLANDAQFVNTVAVDYELYKHGIGNGGLTYEYLQRNHIGFLFDWQDASEFGQRPFYGVPLEKLKPVLVLPAVKDPSGAKRVFAIFALKPPPHASSVSL